MNYDAKFLEPKSPQPKFAQPTFLGWGASVSPSHDVPFNNRVSRESARRYERHNDVASADLVARAERAAKQRFARMTDHLPWSDDDTARVRTRNNGQATNWVTDGATLPAPMQFESARSPDERTDAATLRSALEQSEREHTALRIADALRPTRRSLQICQLRNIARGDADYAARIARHLGVDPSEFAGSASSHDPM